jgi:(p)ppGpp synthase/HD superfamily hydrolase
MTAAILHDVVEDTNVSLNDLRQSGFPENVIEAVNVLTKREKDDYFHYVRKVKNNKIAKLVKDADLRDNMDLSRIPHPEKKDLERVEKYTKAREILNG